jgi:integrase
MSSVDAALIARVDMDRGMLTGRERLEQTKMGLLFQEPKSKKPHQVDISVFLAEAISTRKIYQAEDLGRRQTGETLVCYRYDGKPMCPENLSRQYPVAVEKAGLTRIRVHGLRHIRANQIARGRGTNENGVGEAGALWHCNHRKHLLPCLAGSPEDGGGEGGQGPPSCGK